MIGDVMLISILVFIENPSAKKDTCGGCDWSMSMKTLFKNSIYQLWFSKKRYFDMSLRYHCTLDNIKHYQSLCFSCKFSS